MHCVICDYFDNPDEPKTGRYNKVLDDPVTGKPTCYQCTQASYEGRNKTEGWLIPVEDCLAELERRIPSIFVGPVCPGNGICRCTNKCKLLDGDCSADYNILIGPEEDTDGQYEQGIIQDPVPSV